jgi:hypothetical protein
MAARGYMLYRACSPGITLQIHCMMQGNKINSTILFYDDM